MSFLDHLDELRKDWFGQRALYRSGVRRLLDLLRYIYNFLQVPVRAAMLRQKRSCRALSGTAAPVRIS